MKHSLCIKCRVKHSPYIISLILSGYFYDIGTNMIHILYITGFKKFVPVYPQELWSDPRPSDYRTSFLLLSSRDVETSHGIY